MHRCLHDRDFRLTDDSSYSARPVPTGLVIGRALKPATGSGHRAPWAFHMVQIDRRQVCPFSGYPWNQGDRVSGAVILVVDVDVVGVLPADGDQRHGALFPLGEMPDVHVMTGLVPSSGSSVM